MTEFTAKIVRGGMITLPIEIRQTQKLKEGDYVRLELLAIVGTKKGGS